jgi:anti-anti-sigma regulatory factor
MTMIDVWVELDGSRAGQALHEATEKRDSAGGDVFLDFSAVRRLDPRGLRALEDFASGRRQSSHGHVARHQR